jgi:cyclic nucleotide gated channel
MCIKINSIMASTHFNNMFLCGIPYEGTVPNLRDHACYIIIYNVDYSSLFCYFQIAGGCWYVLAIQRVASCLRAECQKTNNCNLMSLACSKEMCFQFPWSDISELACDTNLTSFGQTNLPACLSGNGAFAYGIYKGALPVISSNSLAVKILYPIFWGLMTLR